jgi:hypothetical protein
MPIADAGELMVQVLLKPNIIPFQRTTNLRCEIYAAVRSFQFNSVALSNL